MFSLRKYFPHFISPSQSRYFFPSYFPYLSSPSQSNNYFPSPIISLFFFTVLLPPNYPFSSFLFLLCFPSVSWVSSQLPTPLSHLTCVICAVLYGSHDSRQIGHRTRKHTLSPLFNLVGEISGPTPGWKQLEI